MKDTASRRAFLFLTDYTITVIIIIIIVMRPSSLGGGRIMRRTLSVRLSVRPVIVT